MTCEPKGSRQTVSRLRAAAVTLCAAILAVALVMLLPDLLLGFVIGMNFTFWEQNWREPVFDRRKIKSLLISAVVGALIFAIGSYFDIFPFEFLRWWHKYAVLFG